MTNLSIESRLKEALIEKNGSYCQVCGKSDENLQIEHIFGQKEIEKEYFTKGVASSNSSSYEEIMYNYYYNNFDNEMKFIGIICKNCSIAHAINPKLEFVITIIEKHLQNNSTEMEYLISNYPHIIPTVERLFRLLYRDMNKYGLIR